MNAYLSVGKLRFAMGLQYRAAAAAGVATQLFFGFIFMMVYMAFYANSVAEPPMPLRDVVTYVWLQQIFLGFIAMWFRDHDIFGLITSGNIAYELCRPCDIYRFWYAKLLATRLASVALRCAPLLPVVLLLPPPYRMGPPPSALQFGLFVAALLLGLLLVVAISMLIYISVFWTMSPTGSILMIGVAGEFFAGLIVPVPMMPAWLQSIVYALPFRWTADFPFRVYSGHIGVTEALWGIPLQLLWLAALVGAGHLLMRRALRRVVVQGG